MYRVVNAKIADPDNFAQYDKGLFYFYSAYLQGQTFFTHNVCSFIILNSLHSRSVTSSSCKMSFSFAVQISRNTRFLFLFTHCHVATVSL